MNNICRICLRNDRKVKVINRSLSELHDELCNYSLDHGPKYCMECEYLLKKMHKFKVRCEIAIKIYQKWKKTKPSNRKPVSLLYTFLPPSSLGVWTSDNTKILMYEERGPTIKIENHPEDVEIDAALQSDSNSKNVLENASSNGDVKLKGDSDTNLPAENNLKIEVPSKLERIKLTDTMLKKAKEEGIRLQNEYFIEIGNHNIDNVEKTLEIKIEEDTNPTVNDTTLTADVADDFDSDVEQSSKRTRSQSESSVSYSNDFSDDDDSTDYKPIVKKRKQTTKVLRSMSKKDDTGKSEIKQQSEKTFGQAIGEWKRRQPTVYSKERLKSELITQFASCGELKTENGVVIDKQFILDCLEENVKEKFMRQLWNAVKGKPTIPDKGLKVLKFIQSTYMNNYESVFDIEHLATDEKKLEEFQRRKTYECYVDAKYKCELCYQGFKYEKVLENHKRYHEVTPGDVGCPVCAVRYKSKKCYIKHLSSHDTVFKCKLCPLVTYYRYSMVNHYHQHKGKQYKCEPCNITYKSMSAYRTHMGQRHRGGGHVCTACGREFISRMGLNYHKSKVHQFDAPVADGGPSATCEECALTFPSEEVLLKHIRVTHEGKSALGYNAENPTVRRQPAVRKMPVFTCRVCNATGRSNGWLVLHFEMEHPTVDMDHLYADKKKHLCDVCGKGFATLNALREHQNSHTGARPFACPHCPKRFSRAVSLMHHRALHAPPAKACSVCGKKFRSQSNLYNHMQFHIGDRRFKCSFCGKGFLHRSTMNEHVRGVHHNMRRVRKTGVPAARGLSLEKESE